METRGSRIKECTPKDLEVCQRFVQSVFGEAINLLCTDWTEGSDKCEKLPPVAKKNKSQRRTKSFILPLIDLLSSLSDA